MPFAKPLQTNEPSASGQKTESGKESCIASPGKLTEKEFAYHFVNQAAICFGQALPMLSLAKMYFGLHLKKLAIFHLRRGCHWVLGLVPKRVRKSFEPPVVEKDKTSN